MKSKLMLIITLCVILFLQSCANSEPAEKNAITTETEMIASDSQTKSNNAEKISNINNVSNSDSLVIYGYALNKATLEPAIDIFKQKYPNVNIEYKEFDDMLTYFQVMKNEILAGTGPDLIIGDECTFDDIYKVMDTGAFCDLNDFINGDNEINLDDYNKTVMDCGIYKGKRYFMPIDYQVFVLMTTNEILSDEGINSDDLSTFDGYLGALRKYIDNNKSNPGKFVFQWQGMSLGLFFPWCGINYIDYANHKVDLSDPNIKKIMDTYKDMYIEDTTRNLSLQNETGTQVKALRQKEMLFNTINYSPFSDFYFNYGGLLYDHTPVFTNFPNVNGGVTAKVGKFGAIRQTSKNKQNAYNLLKILLSKKIQAAQINFNYVGLRIPVLKSAVYVTAEWERINGNGGLPDGSIIKAPVPQEVSNKFINMLVNIDSCELPANVPLFKFLIPGMEPYFKGEKTYDACIKDVTKKLEIYISE